MTNKKRLLQVAVIIFLFTAAVAAWYWSGKLADQEKRQGALPSASAGQTLINFAKYASGNSKAHLVKMESANVLEVRKLLSTVDIDDFVDNEQGCQRDPDSWYLFGVTQVPGRYVPGDGKQSLIAIEVGVCGELRFNARHHVFLVVNGKIRQHFDACMDSAMLLDVSGPNALQDILLLCNWFHMGVTGTSANIYGYRSNQFGVVLPLRGYEDSCDAHPHGESVWSILKRGKAPGLYREDVHNTRCTQ